MKARNYKMSEIFGSFLAEGAKAAAFRVRDVEPSLRAHEEIVLDFSGVHNLNSSFANTLVAPLIEQHGECVLKQVRFRNCNPIVRIMIESALSLGLERAEGSSTTDVSRR
jgi:anti-anti-sigma regulatory factor